MQFDSLFHGRDLYLEPFGTSRAVIVLCTRLVDVTPLTRDHLDGG